MGFRGVSTLAAAVMGLSLSIVMYLTFVHSLTPISKPEPARVLKPMLSGPNKPIPAAVLTVSSPHKAEKPAKKAAVEKPKVFMGPVGPKGPVIASAGPNTGKVCSKCIFVAVTTCCKTWNTTRVLLSQLLASDDNIHVAVFDDISTDEGVERVRELGITVVQPESGKGVGLTELMNLAWRYYYARPELDTMMLMNNDLQISTKGTFRKLNRCLHSFEVPWCIGVVDGVTMQLLSVCVVQGGGVVGPMTNAIGLGTGYHLSAYMSWQNAEHSRHMPLYQGVKFPQEIAQRLPGSLDEYNQWLEDRLGYLHGNVTKHVTTLMGFMMCFRRDHPLHDPETNKFVSGGRNAHQEYYMFQIRKDIKAYMCHDVFVYHDKTASYSADTREAMMRNMKLTNKKGQATGLQS
jgi:hypothetical protein